MRILKQFEMKRLQKIVDNAPEPNEDYREIEAHNPNLVNYKILESLNFDNFIFHKF